MGGIIGGQDKPRIVYGQFCLFSTTGGQRNLFDCLAENFIFINFTARFTL
jgi:hypothetical protein